jgi:hypothetical protein
MKNRKFCNPLIAFYSNSRIKEMQQMLEAQRGNELQEYRIKEDKDAGQRSLYASTSPDRR